MKDDYYFLIFKNFDVLISTPTIGNVDHIPFFVNRRTFVHGIADAAHLILYDHRRADAQ